MALNTYILASENRLLEKIKSLQARYLYIILKEYANDKHFCFPSLETLSKKIGRSVRQIQRYMNILLEAGLIKKIRRFLGKTNIYCIAPIMEYRKINFDIQKIIAQVSAIEGNKASVYAKEVAITQASSKTAKSKPNKAKSKANKNIAINYSGQREYDVNWLEQNLIGRGELSEIETKKEKDF